jgi:hypothetical protein
VLAAAQTLQAGDLLPASVEPAHRSMCERYTHKLTCLDDGIPRPFACVFRNCPSASCTP